MIEKNNQVNDTIIDEVKLNKMLVKVQNPIKYVGSEFGLPNFNAMQDLPVSFCLCFADTYEIGMSNLGNKILIDRLLKSNFVRVERSFMPNLDFALELKKNNEKLFSLETKTYLDKFDVIGFSLGYELCLTNLVNMLELSSIDCLRKNRKEDSPIITAGGPVCFNPSTVMDFCDVILVGDGEQSIVSLASCVKERKEKHLSKLEFLKLVRKNVDGAVIPEFIEFVFNEKKDGQRQSIKEIKGEIVPKAIISKEELSKPISTLYVPITQIIQDKTVVEVFRGCTAGCRFCQAGFCYRPNREKSASDVISQGIKQIDQTGYSELTLSSLSTGDYSCLRQVVTELDHAFKGKNIEISLPSLRVDSFEAKMVSSGKKGSITFAPEAGSDKLRAVINKNITETDILAAMENSAKLGYTGVKMYFMIGLPTETKEDIIAIRDLAVKVKSIFKLNKTAKKDITITVSTSVFIPKPWTPFAWEKFADKNDILEKQLFLKEALRKVGIRYIYHGYDDSAIECFLSRAGIEAGKVIKKVVELGSYLESDTQNFDFQLWQKAIESAGLNLDDYLKEIDEEELLPWEIVDMGITKNFLLSERHKSRKAAQTENCCKNCNNCGMQKYYDCQNKKLRGQE